MPPRDPRAYLWDVLNAGNAIEDFVAGLDVASYCGEEMVHAAVERKFEIIGEALNQLSKQAPQLASNIPELASIVAFRNQLIRGYATIERTVVWNITKKSLPDLLSTVGVLLAELDAKK